MNEILEHTVSKWAKKLQLPTHPAYDFETDPTGQPEYVNPVTLNNYLVVYGNAQNQLSDYITTKNVRVTELKSAQRKKQRELDDFEESILRKSPPALERHVKTLKLQNAYIAAKAAETGREVEHRGFVIALRSIEDEIEEVKSKIDTAKLWIKTLEDNTVKIQTHLSFVKSEVDRVKRFG
jgi:chaperonin cofactor prefoldin